MCIPEIYVKKIDLLHISCGSGFMIPWSLEISDIQMDSILFFYEKGEENSQENYISVSGFKKTGFGRIKSMNTLPTDLNWTWIACAWKRWKQQQ